MKERFYSFNKYLREKFGQRIHKISLDAGFSCPNINGNLSSQGCVFCNNKAFSHFGHLSHLSLEEQILEIKDYAKGRVKANKYIAYFQSNSSTYGDIEFLRKQYNTIRKFNDFVGISISTRPDCIDEKKLDLIEEFTKDYEVYIEYGLQTVHNRTLKLINRNHEFKDFQKAVELTASRSNIKIGVHIILGLLGETKEDMLATAKVLAEMPIWGVKFHALHVVRDTALAKMHSEGKLEFLSLEEYVDILIDFLELLPETCVVLRLVSDTREELLLAPEWTGDKFKILGRIEQEFKRRKTYQGALYKNASII